MHIIYIIIQLWKKKPRQNRNALRKRSGNKMIVRGLVIVTYAICNAYLYIRTDVIVSFRTGFDIHQMFRPVKGKAGKRFSTIKKKKRAYTHIREGRKRPETREKKCQSLQTHNANIVCLEYHIPRFVVCMHMNKTGSVPPLMAIHFLVFSRKKNFQTMTVYCNTRHLRPTYYRRGKGTGAHVKNVKI